jgi:hypothetical protein
VTSKSEYKIAFVPVNLALAYGLRFPDSVRRDASIVRSDDACGGSERTAHRRQRSDKGFETTHGEGTNLWYRFFSNGRIVPTHGPLCGCKVTELYRSVHAILMGGHATGRAIVPR